MTSLRIGTTGGKAFSLPIEFVTKTTAVLAQRRKGKTYTASVIAEELVAAKQPFVALDPTGAWWGLLSSDDGKDAGLPIVVLGGQHGHVPLERTGGALVADLVLDTPGFYVIDFSLFESGGAERQFATDFAERLYRRKAHAGMDFPLHLFVDEADRFIPQKPQDGDQRMLGAFEAIVRRGGLRGLGTTLISQRAAIVNKNVLEMIDCLITLRTLGPNDQKAIEGYIKAHGTDAERLAMMGSLASLDLGEAWIWEPGADPALFERVQIRKRRTFNSSATPKPGEKRVEPRKLAEVDIAAVRDRMAATIQQAKANDPAELKRQLAAMQREVAQLKASKPVEKPEVSREALAGAEVAGQLRGRDEVMKHVYALRDVMTQIKTRLDALTTMDEAWHLPPLSASDVSQAPTSSVSHPAYKADQLARNHRASQMVERVAPAPRREQPASGTNGRLPPGERATLIACAQHGSCIREQLSILTGYKRSSRDAYIARLREKGYVDIDGERVIATQEGINALGNSYEPLPSGEQLQRYWLDRLPPGEKAVLEVALEAYPKGVARETLDERTGYKRSSRDAYIARLAARQIIKAGRGEIVAAQELFG